MSASFGNGIGILKSLLDAPTAAFFTSCVRCGLCAESCLFYTETGDPRYTPIYKLEPLRRVWRQEYTLIGKLAKVTGLAKPVDDAELKAWSELVYDGCTLCGRCTLGCPMGNDIASMVRKLREGMAAAGHAPKGVVEVTRRTLEHGSPMGIQAPAFLKQVQLQEEECGLPIPVDQEGADYLILMSSMEIIGFPEYLGSLARIFHRAGISWTVSTQAYEATNSGIQIGVSDLARQIVARIVEAAERLKVKYVLSPECGHAYTALRWEGPNLMGRPFGFQVIHVLELLDQLREEGRLPTEGKTDTPLTFHDPCQIVRRGGVVEEPRALLHSVAADFREMRDHGIENWCCGGGGGVSANSRADGLRIKAFGRKKAQIEELGVDTLVTACANCRNVIEEALEHYRMDVKVIGLTELVASHLAETAEEQA